MTAFVLSILGILLLVAGATALCVCAVSSVSIRRTLDACRAETVGRYVREDTAARLRAPGINGTSYAAVVRYEAAGRVWEERVSYSEGLGGFSSREGDPVEVHYDPQQPSRCWARKPNARRSLAYMLPIVTKASAAVAVVGAVMLLAAFLTR